MNYALKVGPVRGGLAVRHTLLFMIFMHRVELHLRVNTVAAAYPLSDFVIRIGVRIAFNDALMLRRKPVRFALSATSSA